MCELDSQNVEMAESIPQPVRSTRLRAGPGLAEETQAYPDWLQEAKDWEGPLAGTSCHPLISITHQWPNTPRRGGRENLRSTIPSIEVTQGRLGAETASRVPYAMCDIVTLGCVLSLGCVLVSTMQRKQQSLHPSSTGTLKEKESRAQCGPDPGPNSSPGKTSVCRAVSGETKAALSGQRLEKA